MKIGFDNEKYLQLQAEHITARRAQFGGKLYLEFGGKLFDDYHASRVLPGFQPDSKIRMLQTLKDDVEIVVAICAGDIEKNKMRGDLGISYDVDVLRLIDVFRGLGFYVGSVVITQYAGQPAADAFIKRLSALGVKSYKHYPIAGYPSDVAHIVSDEGLGKNEYIETTRPLQRQDGHLPEPAVPRQPAGYPGGLRQVRDVPHLEPATEAPGEPGL